MRASQDYRVRLNLRMLFTTRCFGSYRACDCGRSIGYWERSRHHTIVWVEPNPTLFKRLAANTAAIKNKVRFVIASLMGSSSTLRLPPPHIALSLRSQPNSPYH